MKINVDDYSPKDIIRIIRDHTDLTQKEFGKTINKSERTIQNYEGGLANYSFALLLEIAKKHNIDITISTKEKPNKNF